MDDVNLMAKNLEMGPVMLDLEGVEVSFSEVRKLQHPNTGGVILFSRNYTEPGQVEELIKEIRSIRRGNILIAVDQEGGRVQRFLDGFTRLPPACHYAQTDLSINTDALNRTEACAWLMATELRSVDVDFSFAPVLDVDCGISSVIGDRAFSSDAETVSRFATAFRRGMNRAGMAAVGKHFPGHGGVAADSHLALPVDERKSSLILENDLLPFKRLIEEGLEAVMPAHVVYSAFDARPAGFSDFWISNVLRTQLGFDGAVFSDDLSMTGAEYAGDYLDRAELALGVGCDMVLVCNHPDEVEELLDQLPANRQDSIQRRLINMLGHFRMSRKELIDNCERQQILSHFQDLESN